MNRVSKRPAHLAVRSQTLLGVFPIALASLLPGQGLYVGPERPTVTDTQAPADTLRTGSRSPRHRPRGAFLINKSLAVRADIVDGVATTELTQVFHNRGGRAGEAIWILPLPNGATADHFTMTMNGVQVAGEVLDANKARSIYTGIVRRQRDPGLLEYMGKGCLRARVFPILPGKDMKIVVRYRQVLPKTAGLHQWRFPLRAMCSNGRPPGRFSLDLRIRSKKSLKNVYSPAPRTDIVRKGDHQARVSLELSASDQINRDLDVFYGTSEKEFGLDLLTYREKGQPGYFMMMLSPKLAWDNDKTLSKCINFVIDTSGSMQGVKIAQAREALKFFLNSLNPRDHFNVIPFSTAARPFFREMVPANSANVAKALANATAMVAKGGTNIQQALTSALSAKHPERSDSKGKPLGITVFLTDGRATVGVQDATAILRDVKSHNTNGHRIFVFGVGDDVNVDLLDKIARSSHGDRDYVRPEESIEIKTSSLFSKLSHPVMSDVRIACAGIDGYDIYPKTTPDLFKGSRLLLTGRFKGKGSHAVRLHGMVDGKQVEFVYEGQFPEQSESHDFLPTLWAQRKAAMLLDNIRLQGRQPSKELIDEIRRLGTEHGIVTRYSSHLVLERHARSQASRGHGGRYGGPGDKLPPAGPRTLGPGAAGPVTGGPAGPGAPGAPAHATPKTPVTITGADQFFMDSTQRARKTGPRGIITGVTKVQLAIDYSVALRRLATSGKLVVSSKVRKIRGHTFHDLGGFWVDTLFKKGMEKQVRKVKAFSKEYFELLKKHPELARILVLNARVLVVLDGEAIEIDE